MNPDLSALVELLMWVGITTFQDVNFSLLQNNYIAQTIKNVLTQLKIGLEQVQLSLEIKREMKTYMKEKLFALIRRQWNSSELNISNMIIIGVFI